MRKIGPDLGGLAYQHLHKAWALDDEAWIGYLNLVRVGSLRYRALKKSSCVEECQTNKGGHYLNADLFKVLLLIIVCGILEQNLQNRPDPIYSVLDTDDY